MSDTITISKERYAELLAKEAEYFGFRCAVEVLANIRRSSAADPTWERHPSGSGWLVKGSVGAGTHFWTGISP